MYKAYMYIHHSPAILLQLTERNGIQIMRNIHVGYYILLLNCWQPDNASQA